MESPANEYLLSNLTALTESPRNVNFNQSTGISEVSAWWNPPLPPKEGDPA